MTNKTQKTNTAAFFLCLLLTACGVRETAEEPQKLTEKPQETIENPQETVEKPQDTAKDLPDAAEIPVDDEIIEDNEPIPVWFSYTDSTEKDSFEQVRKTVFTDNSHMAEYKDRQTFLSDFGFVGQEPFYCYYDSSGNLQLELYLDEEKGYGCGLFHGFRYPDQYGFVFDTVSDGTWTPDDPYLLTNIYGDTGKDDVEAYEENIVYRDDGKLDSFQSFGIIDWLCEEMELPPDEKIWLVKINYVYRDDGSLFYRDYSHNGRVFFTSGQSVDSYYDELERLVYESAYITHGTLECFYIYDDAGSEPAYELQLDRNDGYYVPYFVRYH